MPDILLIQPPIEDFYLTAKRTMPYGLASIAGAVRQSGFSVDILDGLATAKCRAIPWPDEMAFLAPYHGRFDRSPFGLFHHLRRYGYSLEHLAYTARQSGAFIIGISSLFSAYSEMAMKTADAVKKVCPEAKIVMGGHHPTALPEAVMASESVDYVLRGDGEIGLPLLAKALRQGSSLSRIPGLVRRRSDGTLSIGAPAVAPDLNALPLPAFDLIRWSFYQRFGRASLSLSASRGCPMKCTYCAVNAMSYHGFRKRSVASVMAELAAVEMHKPIGFIDFEDEHLCADRQWFIDLMAAIGRKWGEDRPELRAMNGLYAPALDETVIAKMQQTGFQTLNLALITTSTDQLKRFRRQDLRPHLDRVLTMAQGHAMSAVAYLIVAGPSQEPDASLADLLYLAQRRVLAGVSVFYPAPGSADYAWCEQMQCLPSSFGLMRATALPVAHLTHRRQTMTLLRLGRILNFMKTMVDQNQTLPIPSCVPRSIDVVTPRLEVGRMLLAGFLNDGGIRGVDARGHVYDHVIDTRLSHTFVQGLKTIRLQGAGG